MRRLIEEYGITILYAIAGIICIVLFSLAFFGDNTSVSKVINSSIESSANQDLTIVYEITYDGMEGATFGTQEVPTTYTKENRVFLPIPTKADYLFAGWTGTRLTDATVNVVIPEGSTGNRNYTATWTKGYYRIVYDSNINEYINKYTNLTTPVDSAEVSSWMEGTTESQLAEFGQYPTINSSGYQFRGHTFVGWNTKADGSGDWYMAGTSSTVDLVECTTVSWTVNEVTLYAQWEEEVYNIDYVHANQSVIVAGNQNPVEYTVTDTVVMSEASLTGYTFDGWYLRDPYLVYETGVEGYKELRLNASDSEHYDTIVPGTTGDITLYSHFNVNKYLIHFVYKQGTDGSEDLYFEKEKSYDENLELVLPAEISEETLKIDGYDFFGWDINASAFRFDGVKTEKLLKINEVIVDKNIGYSDEDYKTAAEADNDYIITVYPVYGPHSYIIEYMLDGGTGDIPTQVKVYGQNLTLDSTEPVKTGYTFEGWYFDCNEHGGEMFSAGDVLDHDIITEDFEVASMTAIWEANEYVVTFEKNVPDYVEEVEIQGFVSSKTVVFGQTYGDLEELYLSTTGTEPDAPEKYLFDGWFMESDCINEVTESTVVDTASDHKLYACWTPVKYKINLHSNY